MRPDGANSPKEQSLSPSLPARIDAADVTKINEVNDVSTSVDKKIREFFSQGSENDERISDGEMEQLGHIKSSLLKLYDKVRYQYVRAEDEAAKTYKKLADNLLSLIQKTTKASEGNNPYEVASYEPDNTDSQKAMTESEWLASVPAGIKDTYLRICEPEKYQGHGGPLNVAQKSNAAKAAGLQGLLKEYRSKLTVSQQSFLQKTINGFNELAKQDKETGQQVNSKRKDNVQQYWAGVKQGKGPQYGKGSRISEDMQIVYPESEYNKEKEI